MATKLRCALIFVLFVLGSALCAYAQLRPEVTVKPKKPPPPKVTPKPAEKVAPKPAQVIIETSPNAEVYLDDQFVGRASPQGRLVIGNPKPGERALRVSLAGKRDYEAKVVVVAGQLARVTAALSDFPDKDTQLVLNVAATQRAWVAVDADGKTVLQRVMNPNEVETLMARESFDVVTGNAEGIILTLNGETLKPLGRRGEVKSVHLGAEDVKP